MERTTLVCSAQGWCGPSVSTFSTEWDDNVNSFLMAPDVIKPPPQFQDPEEPSQASPTNSAVVVRRDKDCMSSLKKARRSRPTSNIALHRHSLPLSTNISSNPGMARRQCESYALSYPSSSSEDSGSDSTSARRGDRLLDAVPRSRSRSIVLRKAKRKPAPPVRTVSLQRLTAGKQCEEKKQTLLTKDFQNTFLLPDLIPTAKPVPTAEATNKVLQNPSISCHRALNELRSSEPCKSSLGPSVATPINEGTPGNSDVPTSPSSSHSSPSQPSISSPSKPLGPNSPSSGYGSQCETPTQSVLTLTNIGPFQQLGCRMRPKPLPGQRARNRNARLSLQLPEIQQRTPDPEPTPVQPKPNRRYSDSTEATRPKQRMSNSMFIMPMVTQEDLNKVHLRSVSSSDLENARETAEVIEEETERPRNSLSPTKSPKAKPPVAPKPQRNKWPHNVMVQTPFETPSDTEPPTVKASKRQDEIYAVINKAKSPVTEAYPNIGSIAKGHHQSQQQFFDGHVMKPVREPHRPQPPCTLESQNQNVLPFNKTNRHDLKKKRRAPTPPLAKTSEADNPSYDNSARTMSGSDDIQSPSQLCKSPKSPTSASQYHVTLYGVIPSYPMDIEQQQHSSGLAHPTYEVDKRDQMPDLGALQLVGEKDDVFLYRSKSHTTEDLFTIIHRSKRKLLGRKDSFENKQGDTGTQTLGSGCSKNSSQNDNFMAFLRRTRSAKAGCSGRISATELLKNSKPTATIAANMTPCKNSYGQSHGP